MANELGKQVQMWNTCWIQSGVVQNVIPYVPPVYPPARSKIYVLTSDPCMFLGIAIYRWTHDVHASWRKYWWWLFGTRFDILLQSCIVDSRLTVWNVLSTWNPVSTSKHRDKNLQLQAQGSAMHFDLLQAKGSACWPPRQPCLVVQWRREVDTKQHERMVHSAACAPIPGSLFICVW